MEEFVFSPGKQRKGLSSANVYLNKMVIKLCCAVQKRTLKYGRELMGQTNKIIFFTVMP